MLQLFIMALQLLKPLTLAETESLNIFSMRLLARSPGYSACSGGRTHGIFRGRSSIVYCFVFPPHADKQHAEEAGHLANAC